MPKKEKSNMERELIKAAPVRFNDFVSINWLTAKAVNRTTLYIRSCLLQYRCTATERPHTADKDIVSASNRYCTHGDIRTKVHGEHFRSQTGNGETVSLMYKLVTYLSTWTDSWNFRSFEATSRASLICLEHTPPLAPKAPESDSNHPN